MGTQVKILLNYYSRFGFISKSEHKLEIDDNFEFGVIAIAF